MGKKAGRMRPEKIASGFTQAHSATRQTVRSEVSDTKRHFHQSARPAFANLVIYLPEAVFTIVL